MSKEAIVERILSDAEREAEAVVKSAEEKAAATVDAASRQAEKGRRESEADVKARAESIAERKAAGARLDGAKILLAEKRRVIDGIYARALERLIALGKEECLALADRLLKEYAEAGDEILFAENYRYVEDVAQLPVSEEKKLKISKKKAMIDGGFVLKGKTSDKDLSYGALLAADREEYQAELAAEIFRK